ncbi:prolyl aminopeptidase [Castellaniella sp.]|uniref:prolyl aminopeptidase n=1 Tax=Castellaniella sp. TaxID=1955812 RepID=UPI00355FAF8D
MYPEINPHAQGHLDVGHGHQVYWELCGNPQGRPAIFLHGGPGAGCSVQHRRLFDPQRYHILLFDQRGCGRSTPGACLEHNTTQDLVADIERLRIEILQAERMVVFGGSWGSTLALAYAQSHPRHVAALILRGIFLLRRAELRWFYQEGASWLFPDHWQDYLAPIPADERHDLITAYHQRLTGPDDAARLRAAHAWTQWESRTISLLSNPEHLRSHATDAAALAFARIENHYFHHHGFIEEGQLLAQASQLADIPGVIIQGRYDVCTPARSAWDLHQAWPQADFHLIPDAGHAYDEPGILKQLLAATDHFAHA